MPIPVTDDMLDTKTPEDVVIRSDAREPNFDPTLGIPAKRPAAAALPAAVLPPNRLVTVGDSLTHGFQSLAIFHTDISYPAIIAYEMGCLDQFRRPTYNGFGGLPLNLEFLIRDLESEFGDQISWWELPLAYFRVHHFLSQLEDWWERGPGSQVPIATQIKHNLGVYGWDLRDALSKTTDWCQKRIKPPDDSFFAPMVQNANERAALRVLPQSPLQNVGTLGAAEQLSQQGGTADGIETLLVLLGANNVLDSVVRLKVVWSQDPGYDDLGVKDKFTVWRPTHFKKELDLVVAQVKKIKASHVILGTVPHVTIAPIAHGVATGSARTGKVRPGSRYFPFYTYPWISDQDFDPNADPHITANEARAVDSAVDQYNDFIEAAVRDARNAGLDWYLIDMAGLLDRLASRRYIEDPAAQPAWWKPYPLPPALAELQPPPDSRFLVSGPTGRVQGGLFALDGVHPTTVAYGILAQEVINIMRLSGVRFFSNDRPTERIGPIEVDFDRLISLDTLISNPPRSLGSDLKLIGWLEHRFDLVRRIVS